MMVLGAWLGAVVNWLIYSQAFHRRLISPWSAPPPEAPPRRRSDRLPIAGWIGLRRESHLHGRWHWGRPLAIEVFCAAACAALYWWETEQLALFPPGGRALIPAAVTHAQLASHLLLLTLLTAATFVDFDEQTVPDGITLPGTLIAPLLAAWMPYVLLPAPVGSAAGLWTIEPLMAAMPRRSWPAAWDQPTGLWVGWACFTAWCYAICPKLCTLRRGWKMGVRFWLASLWRYNRWWQMPLLWLAGCVVVGGIWSLGGLHWHALLTSLIGIVVGGGFIWGIRVVAGSALQVEAMGFGDVTLMAMIGAFLGWQASLLVFFLAPFAALFISLAQFAAQGENKIAFGPYLSLAALATVVCWQPIWARTSLYFTFGQLIFGVLLVGLFLMGAMLMAWRAIRDAFF